MLFWTKGEGTDPGQLCESGVHLLITARRSAVDVTVIPEHTKSPFRASLFLEKHLQLSFQVLKSDSNRKRLNKTSQNVCCFISVFGT